MTEPLSAEERLAAMEANLAGWEQWRSQAVSRFTAVEQLVATGATRIAAIEANVNPVLERLSNVEAGGAGLQTQVASLAAGLAQAQAALTDLDTRLSALGRVARPGRTVIRGQVDQLRADVEALKAQVPEGGEPQ
jgi:chromosome segregation ATPase